MKKVEKTQIKESKPPKKASIISLVCVIMSSLTIGLLVGFISKYSHVSQSKLILVPLFLIIINVISLVINGLDVERALKNQK